jgi:hypothetical protein
MNLRSADDHELFSMNINRMMSHDDLDDDYMCIGLARTPYHPDDDLEPYFEDDEVGMDRNLSYSSELNPKESSPVMKNISSTAAISTPWSVGSITNYQSKKKSQRKPMYLDIDEAILESISSEYYQLIQNLDDSSIGLFGRVRSGGLMVSPSASCSSLTMTMATSTEETVPSFQLVHELLTSLIHHNLIEYEILISFLIYSRRLCGYGSYKKQIPSSSSMQSTNSISHSTSPSASTFNKNSTHTSFFTSPHTSSPLTSSSSSNLTTLPITQHNWKGILLGLLCLSMKLFDDYSMINKDFIEPLVHQQQSQRDSFASSASPLAVTVTSSSSLLQYLNHYELLLIKQFNYSFLITEMEYQNIHEVVTSMAQLSQVPPPRPSTSSRLPSSSSLLMSSSSPRPSSSHSNPSASAHSTTVPSSETSPSPNLSRQTSRSWSWKLRNNRIAVSADDEGN